MNQREIFVLKIFDISHHGRFRPVRIEDDMIEIVHFPIEGAEKGPIDAHTPNNGHTKCRAKICKVFDICSFIQRNTYMLPIVEVSEINLECWLLQLKR